MAVGRGVLLTRWSRCASRVEGSRWLQEDEVDVGSNFGSSQSVSQSLVSCSVISYRLRIDSVTAVIAKSASVQIFIQKRHKKKSR